jgi:rare lipoprotein A
MLRGNKRCIRAVSYVTMAASGILMLMGATASAQTGGPVGFEGRFFFTDRTGSISQQSTPALSPTAEPALPPMAEPRPRSIPDHPAVSDSIVSEPAVVAAPRRGTSKKADVVRPGKPARQPARPLAAGRAAWYQHPGRTASGEKFDPEQLTAAHKSLPFGSRVRVVNASNGRTVVVRVNDRIPAKTKRVVIDLSRRGARAIGIQGIGEVALYRVQ